jgi:DNA sulfur modification protein DndC
MTELANPSVSAFGRQEYRTVVGALLDEIQELYRADSIPWVVGYSGGKDSTAVLQLIWNALAGLKPEERVKSVHVISTDTLVENPVVAAWVSTSLARMGEAARAAGLPIVPHRLTPEIQDSFWVNLIGRGYPAPRPRFRWCTERLKINPSNAFIRGIVRASGEAILVLGTRKAESVARARAMTRAEERRVRDRLSPNQKLPNSLVYTPIEDWSNDDVWLYLLQEANPWGYPNKDLLGMYRGASEDAECPLVVDTTTPSCGDSRFGCWVCTLVEKDRSMQAMIQNDEEKEWMLPLLELRNALGVPDDRDLRDFRRMGGQVQLFNDRPIPGPYLQGVREAWLRRLLDAQCCVRENGPEHVRNLELITLDELHEIRRIWVLEKNEIEDILPGVYEEVVGEPFPRRALEDGRVLGADEIRLLREICGEDPLHFEMVRELLAAEQRFQSMSRRAGLYDVLERAIHRSFYVDAEDATEFARRRRDSLLRAGDGADQQQLVLLDGPDSGLPSATLALDVS